jgi:alpha-tubulin suppressor-like RCC1 family protein
VKCWGNGSFGRLGNNSTSNSNSPVPVSGLTANMVAVAAGAVHTCALETSGEAKCWGLNGSGRLGDGSTTDRLTPVTVSGGHTFTSLSTHASASHTCGVTTSGAVYCWGSNGLGQLGVSPSSGSTTPVLAADLSSGAVEVSVGENHTCARMANGSVQCWGANYYGQLGDNTRTSRSTAAEVVGGATFGASKLSAGVWHTCAVLTSGDVRCWGSNEQGQLGDPRYFVEKNTPIGFSNVARQAKEIRVLP